MGKMSKAAYASVEANNMHTDKIVTNFMGGDSYTVNPLDTLKMVSASSIFGEPSYYRDGSKKLSRNYMAYATRDYGACSLLDGFRIVEFADKTTEDVMVEAIDNALEFDFEGTLQWACSLRNEYFMRLNPQVILARAAMHPARQKFTEKAPEGAFRKYAAQIMSRPDDTLSGMAYYLYTNGSKSKMPSVLKRSYADKLSGLSRYQVNKYKNHEIGMINAVRMCHAHSSVLDELMQTGTVEVSESETTWETLRSEGKSWVEIFNTIEMGHMALLRNLRGVFIEVDDFQMCKKYMEKLKAGVLKGKQFPFRYYTAYKAVKDEKKQTIHHRQLIMDTLEECIDIAVANMPKLSGRTVVLTDNSGSAWSNTPTEYGMVTTAEINNLSAVLTAATSDEGVVVKFGDTIKVYPISKRNGLLKQAEDISAGRGDDVGTSTEGGIWEFMYGAIQNKEHWDNIFIYSDMQAGHGGLYGTRSQMNKYQGLGYGCGDNINVFKLVLDYRKCVNKTVNVFSVQTAGYDNNVLPEYTYRCNLMYGWTGRESVFADTMIKQWDALESRK